MEVCPTPPMISQSSKALKHINHMNLFSTLRPMLIFHQNWRGKKEKSNLVHSLKTANVTLQFTSFHYWARSTQSNFQSGTHFYRFCKRNTNEPWIFSEYKSAPSGKPIKIGKYMASRDDLVTDTRHPLCGMQGLQGKHCRKQRQQRNCVAGLDLEEHQKIKDSIGEEHKSWKTLDPPSNVLQEIWAKIAPRPSCSVFYTPVQFIP